MSLILLLFGICLLLAAAILLPVGWRGRMINDHPWCTACGFDLFQLWPDAERCPECGTDLTSPDAVRRGQRVARSRPLVTGAGLASVGLISLLLAAWAHFSGIDPNSLKPVWWLMTEAKSGTGPTAVTALEELNRRVGGGRLPGGHVQTLIRDGLAYQADPERTWLPQWGDFIETAQKRGLVTDDQWREYLCHIISFRFEGRPCIREGNDWPVCFRHDETRHGTSPYYYVGNRITQIQTGELAWSINRSIGWQGWSARPHTSSLTRKLSLPLGRGRHHVELDVEYHVADPLSPMTFDDPMRDPVSAASWLVTYSADVEIVGREERLVALIDDPSLLETIAALIEVEQLWMGMTTTTTIPADSTQPKKTTQTLTLHCQLSFEAGLPIGMAFDVFLRDGTRRWHLGSGCVEGGSDIGRMFVYHTDPDDPHFADFDARRVDVILTPNAEIAEADSDLLEIWGREIVIEDVPVHWPPDAASAREDPGN